MLETYDPYNRTASDIDYYLDIKRNERKLLDLIKKKLGISDDDMKSIDIVSRKIRNSNINDILNND